MHTPLPSWVRRDRGEAAGWSGNVRYGPDSDRIGFVAVNDVMGQHRKLDPLGTQSISSKTISAIIAGDNVASSP